MSQKNLTTIKIPYLWTAPASTLEKLFKAIDADGSGEITEDEGVFAGKLITGSTEAGQRWWDAMATLVDEDKNGTVERKEFVNRQIALSMERGEDPKKISKEWQAAYDKLEEGRIRQTQQTSRSE
mmetsp:Transcript_19210/g.50490  ORF Transcript_19210/g.50490 Transcript_19210/m.50490 type:complete len:125 (+) Transcript_19210:60-434(+)